MTSQGLRASLGDVTAFQMLPSTTLAAVRSEALESLQRDEVMSWMTGSIHTRAWQTCRRHRATSVVVLLRGGHVASNAPAQPVRGAQVLLVRLSCAGVAALTLASAARLVVAQHHPSLDTLADVLVGSKSRQSLTTSWPRASDAEDATVTADEGDASSDGSTHTAAGAYVVLEAGRAVKRSSSGVHRSQASGQEDESAQHARPTTQHER